MTAAIPSWRAATHNGKKVIENLSAGSLAQRPPYHRKAAVGKLIGKLECAVGNLLPDPFELLSGPSKVRFRGDSQQCWSTAQTLENEVVLDPPIAFGGHTASERSGHCVGSQNTIPEPLILLPRSVRRKEAHGHSTTRRSSAVFVQSCSIPATHALLTLSMPCSTVASRRCVTSRASRFPPRVRRTDQERSAHVAQDNDFHRPH
jgi:hypothetical protein